MRTITITRRKTSIACLATLKMYIEDPAGDTMIDNVPCTKIGTIKNGATETFEIDAHERRIFAIFGKSSRNYCFDSYTIPAGEENVVIAGETEFNPATGNAFRFDGVADEMTSTGRKNGRKRGLAVLIVTLVAVFVARIVVGILTAPESPIEADPKTFTYSNMSITLSEAFEEENGADYEDTDYDVIFNAGSLMVSVIRERFSTTPGLSDLTLKEYARALIEVNELDQNLSIQQENGLTFIEYEDSVDSDTYHYFIAIYRTDNAYWSIQFVSFAEDIDEQRPVILDWAKSVTFDS